MVKKKLERIVGVLFFGCGRVCFLVVAVGVLFFGCGWLWLCVFLGYGCECFVLA